MKEQTEYPKKNMTVNIGLNVEALHSAMKNAERPQEALLEVPIVNPKDLRLDDKIFNVALKDISYKSGTSIPKQPNTVKYASINAINVDALNKGVKEDTITVNGSIDIPTKTGRTVNLDQIFVAKEEQARGIARVFTEVQLERIGELEDRIAQEKEFLLKQVDNDRY